MKVLLSHLYAWPEVRRGAERYVHELAAALQWLGNDVRVVTSSATPGRTEVLGVPVLAVPRSTSPVSPASRRTQVGFAARTLAPALRFRPDVWHANSLYDGGLAATLPGLKAVFTLHGPVTAEAASRPVVRRLARAELVSVSEPQRLQAEQQGLPSTVVPPGVDTELFTPGRGRSRHPVVLYVGTLAAARKNVSLLLTAAAEALPYVPDLEVWLAGEGDPEPLLRAAPPVVRDRVRHLGALDGCALVEAYQRAWCVALLSEREVFGMAVLEGLACGLPGLVLDDGWGPAGLVAGGCGVATSAEDAAEALVRVLELASERGTRGRCRSRAEEHDWRRVIAPRMLEVYCDG